MNNLQIKLVLVAVSIFVVGCSGETLVPVTGAVYYNNEPLEFGSVIFQPRSGQPSFGKIGSDGTFQMMTPKKGDGVPPGSYQISITCYESQRPGAVGAEEGEVSLGRLLIPERYTIDSASGMSVEVKASGNEPLELRMYDEGSPGKKRT